MMVQFNKFLQKINTTKIFNIFNYHAIQILKIKNGRYYT